MHGGTSDIAASRACAAPDGERALSPAAVARDRQAASAHELLVAKLTVPAPRGGTVMRGALVERLSASTLPIATVIAAAGYGKTTLLGQWAASDPRPFAWVTVDKRDNDPALLLAHVVAALGESEPVDESVTAALSTASISIWSRAMPRLGSSLASRSLPFVLVLDDAHELVAEDVCEAVAALARHVPDGSQLVLVGRADPRPEAARLRVAGAQLEIGAADLALSLDEASLLLEQAGATLGAADVRLIHERAEGWPAGLYLAALALRGADGAPTALPSEFAGDDRLVADYLRREHLERLPGQQLRFLTRSAVLDRMCASLCDAVLERNDSGRMLEAVARSNLFLVPLDRTGDWYRYHHLFRGALRAELARSDPDLVATLNLRAADWCEEHGLVEPAIAYAGAAADVDRVARLIATHGNAYYRAGRVATLEEWLAQFDDLSLVDRYPMVGTLGVWTNALRGRPEDAERWASAVELSTYAGPAIDGSASIRPWIDAVRALLCRHGVTQMRSDAERALLELSPQSPWRAAVAVLSGMASLLLGDEERAHAVFVDASRLGEGTGSTYATVVALGERALIMMGRSEHAQARDLVEHALSLLDEERLWDYTPTAILSAAAAQLALHQGDGERARSHLANAERLLPQLTYALPHLAVQTRLELASVQLALADAPRAEALLREINAIMRHRPDLGLLGARVTALRTRLATIANPSAAWASTLTVAELRLLPLLTTHLSFREIGERLHVSRNTVKTQAISTYRKLGASSRSEAVTRAADLGLVELAAGEPRDFTPPA
jgi:LuxR family maltose regulon positive regulatory protein